MNTQYFDPVKYKDGQRQVWDSLAAGWDKWWPTQEQALRCVSNRLVDLAEIQSGDRVMDICTGIGEPAITASIRVGSAGHVVATDLSPQMLAIARKRAKELKIKNLEFRVMDAEAMDFPENTFNAILCRFSLMFLIDLAAALERIRLMLAPGGKFAASVWDVAPKNPLFSLAYSLAQKIFQLPPQPVGTPSIFNLAEGILEKALIKAGFNNVHAELLSSISELPSAEALTQFLRDVNAPLVSMLAAQTAQRQAEYWQAFMAAMQEYAMEDGSIHIPGTAICVVGQR